VVAPGAQRAGDEIRAWARRDAMARQAVDEADAGRISCIGCIGCIAQVFSALGVPIAWARARAFELYGSMIAESMVPGLGSAAQREERARFVGRLLTQVPVSPVASPAATPA
jgi:hypothetical protein